MRCSGSATVLFCGVAVTDAVAVKEDRGDVDALTDVQPLDVPLDVAVPVAVAR
jgi:hypothetical protein